MNILLTGALVLLTAVLYAQWYDWSPPAAPPPSASAPPAVAAPPAPVTPLPPIPPQSAYAVVTERPLFLPERRPPPPGATSVTPEGQTPAADASVLDNFDLSAIIIVGQSRSAWVRKTRGPELVRVRLGEDVEGWQVKDIAADSIVLAQRGETKQLILRDYNKPPPAIPPTRAALPSRSPAGRPPPTGTGAVPARASPPGTRQPRAGVKEPAEPAAPPPEPPKPAFGPG